jgi:hypothetical protein
MTPPPTSIDGTDITGATIDGQDVQEITVDGQTVFTAGPPVTRLYTATPSRDVMEQFDLNNRFDLTGATKTAQISNNGVRDITIVDEGNRVLYASYSNREHQIRSLSTPYDIGSAGGITSTLGSFKAHGVSIDPSGVNLLSAPEDENGFDYFTLGTPFDLGTATLQDEVGDPFVRDIDYVNEGEYVFGLDNNVINKWELSTPYDFTTRFNNQTFSISSDIRGIHVTDDGQKVFFGDTIANEVREFNLSTPYDIDSRGTQIDSLSVAGIMGIDLV